VKKLINIKRVTMQDVAKLAGVSRALVSRVLNGDENLTVRQVTRQKILDASQELHYRPNALARGLRLKHSGMIGLLIPNIGNPFFGAIIKGVSDVMMKNDLLCIICDTFESPETEMRYVQLLDDRQVDGLIVATATIDDKAIKYLEKHGIKFVYATRYSYATSAPFIVVDTYKGFTQATRHLIELGHKRIAHITGNLSTNTGIIALRAFRDEMERNNLTVREDYISSSDYLETTGYNAMCSLLALENMPTAVVACTDSVAINAILAIRKMGLRVPQDISITGYNNIWASSINDPPLTTINAPLYDIGTIAANLLIDLLNKRKSENTQIVLEPKLIVRGSTMKVPF
jgi:DNA-binding LacI/PurR family transcriptional regulator